MIVYNMVIVQYWSDDCHTVDTDFFARMIFCANKQV